MVNEEKIAASIRAVHVDERVFKTKIREKSVLISSLRNSTCYLTACGIITLCPRITSHCKINQSCLSTLNKIVKKLFSLLRCV